MVQQKLTNAEIVARGRRLYDENLRVQMEREHRGRFLVVDVYSGDYAIGKNDIEAITSMLAKRPEAMVYGVRIGDEVAYSLGAGTVGKPA